MSLRIRCTSGLLTGKAYKVRVGLTIGRRKGEILLDDPKVSSLHAFVEADGKHLVLRDNGSKNGIRVGGERVEFLALVEGVEFMIGDSSFCIEADAPEKPKAESPELTAEDLSLKGFDFAQPPPAKDPAGETLPPSELSISKVVPALEPAPEPAPPPEGKRWHEILDEVLRDWSTKAKSPPQPLAPFDPGLTLSFIGGLQAETVWQLGYGPRRAGSVSVDLPIFEPGAPEVCFELIPSPSGVVFRTGHADRVKINGSAQASKTLSAGDIITIGDTRIEVGVMA